MMNCLTPPSTLPPLLTTCTCILLPAAPPSVQNSSKHLQQFSTLFVIAKPRLKSSLTGRGE